MAERIEQAVILAAGEGQRLRPFTGLKPKVMIPTANKPILQYVVEAVVGNGIRHLLMVVGYRKEQVQDFFGSGEKFGAEIDYVVQKQQLGTAHALKLAKGLVEDNFLVISGDNIIDAAALADLVKAGPDCILAKRQVDVSQYGVILAEGGRVKDLVEKPREAESNLVSTGIYAFTREVFDFIGEETELPTVIRHMLGQGHEIRACETVATWLDAVYPWDLLRINNILLGALAPERGGTVERGVVIKGPVSVGKGTLIRANSYLMGPLVIGEGCEVGPGACLFPATTIGNNVNIFAFTCIRNSIIGDNVEIGGHSLIQDSVIDRGCKIDSCFITRSAETEVRINAEYHRVRLGALMGEDCAIEDNVITQPGIRVGNSSRIRALKVLGEDIADGSLVV